MPGQQHSQAPKLPTRCRQAGLQTLQEEAAQVAWLEVAWEPRVVALVDLRGGALAVVRLQEALAELREGALAVVRLQGAGCRTASTNLGCGVCVFAVVCNCAFCIERRALRCPAS